MPYTLAKCSLSLAILACGAETRSADHTLQSTDPKIGESSSFQEGESDTRADHGDGDLPQRFPK